VATRLNLPDLYGAIKLAYAFGARGFMLNRFNVGGRGRKHVAELLPSPSNYGMRWRLLTRLLLSLTFL